MTDSSPNMSDWLDGWARFQLAKPALHFAGKDVSYADIARRVGRMAGLLDSLGVSAGDRIAFLGLNHPELLVLLFAAARLGAVLCPLNWRLAPPEHAVILRHAEPRVVVAETEFVEALDQVAGAFGGAARLVLGGQRSGWTELATALEASPPDAGRRTGRYADPVLIVYTSGTTGQPKGAVLTQSALLWNAVNSTHAHDLVSADRVLTFLPMFHVGGLNIQTVPALHAGATVILHRRFEPDAVFAAIEGGRPSLTLMVPAVMQALIGHERFAKADLSSLRLINAGSSVIPPALIEAFHRKGVPVGQIYGSTETGPIAAYLRREDAFAQVGSAGKPAVHCRIRIVDDENRDVPQGRSGELLVKGPNLMCGYWRDPAATQDAMRDGWFRTGDIGYVAADGYIWINDRKKDVIISGGENIYPGELESLLAGCDEIAEAAVVARPDARWGEVPIAVVVRRDAGLDRQRVLDLFEGRLARFKHPRDVVFIERLPRNVMGKVLRHELRARLTS